MSEKTANDVVDIIVRLHKDMQQQEELLQSKNEMYCGEFEWSCSLAVAAVIESCGMLIQSGICTMTEYAGRLRLYTEVANAAVRVIYIL